MNKQEREKLRNTPEHEMEEYENRIVVGHKLEGKDIFKEVIPALLDQIDALERQVEPAFREGYKYGWSDGISSANYSRELGEDNAWLQSDAAIASTSKCETCNGHGMIGGFVNAENGYDSEPCPACNSASASEGKCG